MSGAYVGSDMPTDEERQFLSDVLKVRFDGVNRSSSGIIKGLGTTFDFYRQLNEQHYAATSSDILLPSVDNNCFPAMAYENGTSAAVAYQGTDYRAFTIGFPLECISEKEKREQITRGIINFLTNN